MNLRSNRHVAFPPNRNPDLVLGNEPPPPLRKNRSSRPLISAPKTPNAGKKIVRGPARGSWTKEALESAIDDIEDGVFSIRKAGLHYGIPQTTLRNHLYGKSKDKFGSVPKALTVEEEKLLVEWALKLADEGRAVNLDIMKQRVAQMTINRSTCFKNGLPGRKWWKHFRGRHPEISFRTPQCIELTRIKAMTSSNLKNFYSTLRAVYDEHNFDASRIWNCDESGVQAGCRTGMRVVAKKGQRNVTEHIPKSREWMTVLVCVNASGNKIPNLYVLKGKRMRDINLISGCEPGASMAFQKKAWITDQLFEAWLDHFRNNVPGGVSKEKPHLLICDGHGSHVNMATIMKAREIGLHIVQLPPHTSHRLQPLDVSCFRPFKLAFRKLRAHFMHSKYGVEPTKEDLATIVSNSLIQALSSSNICAGFSKTGIWPWEPSRVQPEPLAEEMEAEGLAAQGGTAATRDEGGAAAATDQENDVADESYGDDSHVQDILHEEQVAAIDGDATELEAPNECAAEVTADSSLVALAEVAIGLPPNAPSTNNNEFRKLKPKRLRLPESLKGRLLVTSDEMVRAKLEHQRQCEEAARIRHEQLEEKKRVQAQRKEAKEAEKKRREENKRLREEKKAALEKERIEIPEPSSRPKRTRKRTLKMIEYEEDDSDECYLIAGNQEAGNQEAQVEENPEMQVGEGCESQGLDLFVDISLPTIQVDQMDDEADLCRKKRRMHSPNESSDESDAPERIKALDDLYRAEAYAHLQSLGL